MALKPVIGGFVQVPTKGVQPVIAGLVRNPAGGRSFVLPGGLVQFSTGSPDPLAGIVFAIRAQNHNGDLVPLGYYQDVACTIPAVTEFDTVMGWKDEFNGIGLSFTQADPDKSPLLIFVNGVPILQFDGVDDELSAPLADVAVQTIFLMCKSLSSGGSGFGRALSYIENREIGAFGAGGKWAWFSPLTNSALSWNVWGVMAVDIQSNAVAILYADGVEGATLNPSDVSVSTTLTIGSQGGNHYLPCDIAAVLGSHAGPTPAEIVLVSEYLLDINAAL